MNVKSLLVICLFFVSAISIRAQDAFHYTLFDFTEIAMNPALAGSFEGTVRAGGIFREQDFGLQIGQYRNPVLFLDAPVIRGFKKNDWIGIGMYYMYDQQRFDQFDSDTNIDLITTKIFGGLSYHLGLDKKNKNVLSFGIQSGSSNSYFSNPNIVTWSEFGDDPKSDPAEDALPIKDPSGGSNGSTGRANYIGGIHFTSNISAEKYLKLGVSVSNIGRISNSIAGSGGSSISPVRILFHGRYLTPVASKISLEPRVFFQYMQPSWEMSVQAITHFLLNPEKGTSIGAGLGFNTNNGLQFLLNADVKNFRFGYSFDINLSDKTAVSGAAAAFEFGVAYILKFYKKPNPDPVLVCPRI
jgi:type IX secretion system PorP/SprF family membrane protein